MNFQQSLLSLLTGKDLTQSQSSLFFHSLFEEKITKEQAKTFLLLLARKGERAEEITGCLKAIHSLEPVHSTRIPHLMDTCGTGGDQSHSFNISTAAAFVIAGAGGKIAKHGNYAISSKSGSSDLMEALGIKLNTPLKRITESIKKNGIGYFHAPYFHPVFSRIQPLRRELKTRTLFNLIGPLLNPLSLDAQLIGVSQKKYLGLFANILRQTGIRRALIVHGAGGMDELSTAGINHVALVRKGKIVLGTIHPGQLGFKKAKKQDYRGGTPAQNAKKAVALLQRKINGPLRDVVILNAAAGLYISGLASSLREGVKLAENSIVSGKAYQAFLGLKKSSNKL